MHTRPCPTGQITCPLQLLEVIHRWLHFSTGKTNTPRDHVIESTNRDYRRTGRAQITQIFIGYTRVAVRRSYQCMTQTAKTHIDRVSSTNRLLIFIPEARATASETILPLPRCRSPRHGRDTCALCRCFSVLTFEILIRLQF